MDKSFSKLSYGQVQSMAEQLHSAAGQMDTLLNEIKGLFDKVGTDDVWSGTAASQTKERFDSLSGKFSEFNQAIDDCHKYLLNVVESYKAVDAAVNGQ